MERELKLLLEKVQISRACHQKNVKILKDLYQKTNYDDFKILFARYLEKVIAKKSLRNEYIDRALDFMANFVAVVTLDETCNETDAVQGISSHRFLSDIVMETLKYHDNALESIRYHACMFLRLILNHLGNQIILENDICDTIQDAMLQRTLETKSVIRLQAIIALVRLQDPTNKDCPVINAYLSRIADPNARIRAEVVKSIAPSQIHNVATLIKDRLRDVDHNVRINTYKRIADLGPRYFKIVDRQEIIKCGIFEKNELAKKTFSEYLLIKWFNSFDRDLVIFLKALKLDAQEEDLLDLEMMSNGIMNIFFRSLTMEDIIKCLPIDQNKLIPMRELSAEVALLWNIIVNHLRKSEDMDDTLELLLPELTPFCNYIDGIMNESCSRSMDDFQRLDYYYMVFNLFVIVEHFDLTDEVGRRTLSQLVLKILKGDKLPMRLTKKLVEIFWELTNKQEDFTTVMCELISEIREPLVPVEITENQSDDMNRKFELASLKVKLDQLQINLEEALENQDFLNANELKQSISHLKIQIDKVAQPTTVPVQMVRTSRDDPQIICWCLDLLISLLELPGISKMTASLLTTKDSFVLPLLKTPLLDISWRVLNVLSLFALLDASIAVEITKIISIPIITYRSIPNYHKEALLVSIKAVADLLTLYGSKVFGSTENTVGNNHTKRKLYSELDVNESIINVAENFDIESIMDILLDMLDDDISIITETAALALTKLLVNNVPVTPAFISRIFLKWYNPNTTKLSQNLQQFLGLMIGTYTNQVKGAKGIIASAVTLILTSIASAPTTSPIAEIDIDNLMSFLAVITNSENNQEDIINSHITLAHNVCDEIRKKKNPKLTYYLTKMLTYLSIPTEDKSMLEETIVIVKSILTEEVGLEKVPMKFVQKFLHILETTLKREYPNDTKNETVIAVINDKDDKNTHSKTDIIDNNSNSAIDTEKSVQTSNRTIIENSSHLACREAVQLNHSCNLANTNEIHKGNNNSVKNISHSKNNQDVSNSARSNQRKNGENTVVNPIEKQANTKDRRKSPQSKKTVVENKSLSDDGDGNARKRLKQNQEADKNKPVGKVVKKRKEEVHNEVKNKSKSEQKLPDSTIKENNDLIKKSQRKRKKNDKQGDESSINENEPTAKKSKISSTNQEVMEIENRLPHKHLQIRVQRMNNTPIIGDSRKSNQRSLRQRKKINNNHTINRKMLPLAESTMQDFLDRTDAGVHSTEEVLSPIKKKSRKKIDDKDTRITRSYQQNSKLLEISPMKHSTPNTHYIKETKISKRLRRTNTKKIVHEKQLLPAILEVSGLLNRESRSKSKSRMERESQRLNASGDTMLHTILHEVSQKVSLLESSMSDSVQNSSTSSSSPRRSIRIVSKSFSIPTRRKHGSSFRKK